MLNNLPMNESTHLTLIQASHTLFNINEQGQHNHNQMGGAQNVPTITSTRIRVGIILESICKITDYVQSQGQLQHMCPCMALIPGCKLCTEALLEVPNTIDALEQYLGDSKLEQIQQLRKTILGKHVPEEEQKSSSDNARGRDTLTEPNCQKQRSGGHFFEEQIFALENQNKSDIELYRLLLIDASNKHRQDFLKLRRDIILSGIPVQENDVQSKYSPYMSLIDNDLPIALYFDVLCQRLNVPDELSVLILALIERYFRSKAHQELQQYYDYMNPKSGQVAFGNQDQIEIASIQCRLFENPQVFWTGKQRFTSLVAKRLIVTATLICQKYYTDFFYSNSYVSMVGGLKQSAEINSLETEFLSLVNWRITYSKKSYDYYLQGVLDFFQMPMSPSTLSIINHSQGFINMSSNGQLHGINLSIEISANQNQTILQLYLKQVLEQNSQVIQDRNQQLDQGCSANDNDMEIPDERPTHEGQQIANHCLAANQSKLLQMQQETDQIQFLRNQQVFNLRYLIQIEALIEKNKILLLSNYELEVLKSQQNILNQQEAMLLQNHQMQQNQIFAGNVQAQDSEMADQSQIIQQQNNYENNFSQIQGNNHQN